MSVVDISSPSRNPQPIDPNHFYPVINPSRWEGRKAPSIEWMVEGVAMKGTVVMISGDGGKGKSLLMQQLCASAAIGHDWLGMRVSGGRALMLSCEDDETELWRRQERINMDLLCSMTDVCEGGMILMDRVGQDNALVSFNRAKWALEQTRFFDWLWGFCEREGVQYVVIDTATQTYGGNQNDEIQVMFYISLLRRLAIRIQGCVFITKHPSLTGRSTGTGESGSVTWQNSVRSRLYLHEESEGSLVLKTMKSNYGPHGGKIPLRWENGVLVREPDVEMQYSRRWEV